MEVKLNALRRGDTFALAGINWKVLKELEPAHSGAVQNYFCEAAEDIFQAPFDENGNNNWNNASLRERLNGDFLDALEKERPGILEFIVPTYRDLTADDGLNVYSSLAYLGLWGVRPALTLKSDILVSVDDQEDQAEEPEEITPEQREMALYEKAVAKWGKRAQALKAIEEMSELSQAILKLVFCEDYGIGDEQAIRDNISMERADVEIMLNQLHVIFGDNSEMECKRLDNLESLLEG